MLVASVGHRHAVCCNVTNHYNGVAELHILFQLTLNKSMKCIWLLDL